MGTNPQAGDRSPVRERVGQVGDEEMSRARRMSVEVKDEPQPCCGPPLAALLPCREGCWTCWVWCLWAQQDSLDNSGTGLMWERSIEGTVGLFGDPLLNLWGGGCSLGEFLPAAMVLHGITKSSSIARISHFWT